VTEMTVIPRSDDEIWLVTAAAAEWHDRDLLTAELPEGVEVRDMTADYECLLVTGPASRDILAPLTDADLSLPWLSAQDATVCGRPALLLRVSFAGELGWEVHTAPENVPAIWAAVAGAGARPFGMFALDSLRIEKGYRAWKGDLSTDYGLIESGLGRFVDATKNTSFPGREVILSEKDQGTARRAVGLVVEAQTADAPYMANLWKDGIHVGEVTSGAWGHRVGASIAIGMLRSDLATPGTDLQVDIFGEMCAATVSQMPFWDPKNERIRA
ncbi:MAG: aminomethyltransferase family protein, partial [Pseudomonadota bacterium]